MRVKIFVLTNTALLAIGFVLKFVSLRIESAVTRNKMQSFMVEEFCAKTMQAEPLCEIEKPTSLYGEAIILNRTALIIFVLVVALLLINRKFKLYPSQWNWLTGLFAMILLGFCLVVS